MRLLPADATDDQILDFCRDWVERVAAGRVHEAVDLLWVPPETDPSRRWTAESLTTYVSNYGSWIPTGDRSTWRITSLRTAKPQPDLAVVERRDGNARSGTVLLDVPLNGGEGGLTAAFLFCPHEGRTVVALSNLLVL